ncbi:MAG: hypothetical protein AB7K09_01185 [Planctomycetota bacterium]
MRHLRPSFAVALLLLLLASAPSVAVAQPHERPPAPEPGPEQFAAWCRALSFTQARVQRWAFDKLLAAGPAVVGPAVAALPSATPRGQQLLMLVLAKYPSAPALEAALASLADASRPPAVHDAAIRSLARQPAEIVQAMTSRRLHDAAATQLERLNIYRALAACNWRVSLPVLLDCPPPPAPEEPAAGASARQMQQVVIRRHVVAVDRMLWQVTAFRSASESGGAAMAIPMLLAAPASTKALAGPVADALGAWRRNQMVLRSAVDHRWRVRQPALRALVQLCRDYPLLTWAHLSHADYRIRTLMVQLLEGSDHPLALLATLGAAASDDPASRRMALERLTAMGPTSPEQLMAVALYCRLDHRLMLGRLASRFPDAEYLAWLRAERLRLQDELVPAMFQRGPHDPVACETFRRWLAVQSEWDQYNQAWKTWWAENGRMFAADPDANLVPEFAPALEGPK